MSELNIAALHAAALGDASSVAFGGNPVPVDYDLERDEFVAEVHPLETERARLIPGARYHRASGQWRMPATRAQAAALSGVFHGRLSPTAECDEHVSELFSGGAEVVRDLATPVPIWYSGPHDPTEAVDYQYLCVLLEGVPSVVPHTEAMLAALLAAGAQHAGTKQGSGTQGATGEQHSQPEALERVREAVRATRPPTAGRVGIGSSAEPVRDCAPRGREQGQQHVGESDGDDPVGALPTSLALYPYQQTDVGFLSHSGSVLLGSEMGCGKSPIAAVTLWLGGPGPHLVVAPTSMKYKWAEEIRTWAPGLTPVVIDGSAAKRRKQIDQIGPGTVAVINYESLRTHTRLAPWGGKALTEAQKEPKELNQFDWTTLVVDEAHKIKSPSTKQTMAVKQMGLQAMHRLALTGTPVMNDPDDAWSIMSFVAPEEWGSRNQFRTRYCRMSVGYHGGYINEGLRAERIEELDLFFQPRFLRRLKTDVLADLPEKMDIDYRVLPMTSKQEKVYNALVKDMMVDIGNQLLTAENPLSLLTRLRQVASASPVVDDLGQVVALEKPSNKLDAIVDILEGAPGEPLVVYAESRKFIEFLGQLLEKDYTVRYVTGAQSSGERGRAVEDFQQGRAQVILGTLGAGAEGLTLTRAHRIVLAQQSWSHATNAQAIDRVHRIGQTERVHPIVLLSRGTVDEAVLKADFTKQIRLQELVRDPDVFKALARGEFVE